MPFLLQLARSTYGLPFLIDLKGWPNAACPKRSSAPVSFSDLAFIQIALASILPPVHYWRLRQQFRQIPHVIRNARLHRRGNAQGLMDAAEIVVGEVQAVRRPQILPLLREGIRQPREAAHLHSDCEVLAFYVRCADFAARWDERG